MKNKSVLKKAVIFGVLLLICFSFGIIMGKMASQEDNQKLFEIMREGLKNYSVYLLAPVFLIVNIAGLTYQIVMTKRAKKAAAEFSEDDEDGYEKIERQLDPPTNASNYIIIFNCVLFSLLIESAIFSKGLDAAFRKTVLIASSGVFIAMYLIQFILLRSIVELVKKLNPEKQGDMLDMNFQSRWLASFDEGEKFLAYKCGFNAYKNANMACMLLWVISFITQFTFNTGVMPVICVGIIWAVLSVSYARENKRLSHNSKTDDNE